MCIYISSTPPNEQVMTQGQFLSGLYWFMFRVFLLQEWLP